MLIWEQQSTPMESDLSHIAEEVFAYGRMLAQGGNAQPIACFVRDEDMLVAGGSGRTEFNRLFVSYLWVSEVLRGQGLGTEILRRLETQAIKTSCTSAIIDTLSDQAARLYKRLGYNSVATIPNYVGQFTRHVMVKSFAAQHAHSEA
jgi:ribosomal protein S18 acetylase RimI-like enzyme